MYNVNPLQLIEMIRGGQNPQQLLMSVLEGQAGSNPMSANLLAMAKRNDSRAIEEFARNYFASQGLDFDKEFMAFQQKTGLKLK